MNCLHIVASMDPASGGPAEGIRRIEDASKAFGAEREIVCLDPPDALFLRSLPLKVHALGVRAHGASWSKPVSRYGYSPKLIPWLRSNVGRFDFIVVNGLWNYATFAASRVLPTSGVPYVVYTHGMLDPWFAQQYPAKHLAKQLFWAVCERPLLKRASAVLFTADEERLLAQKTFWGHDYTARVVAYGTADVAGDPDNQVREFRARMPELEGKEFLLFLGRIHPKKGCDLLLQAFAHIASDYPNLDLVIAGPDQLGWETELRSLSMKLGIDRRVHWPGMLSGNLKWGAYRAAEAFVLPSHQENFGIVVAEAMACHTPVLISNKVNIWREVDTCRGGVVGTNDVQGCVSMLNQFLALNAEERTAMGVRARAGFLKYFEIKNAAADLMKVINEVRGSR